jgi:hypothetical protein
MRRSNGKDIDDVFSTADVSPLLVVTTPASGVLTFTPAVDTWGGERAGWAYELFFEVDFGAGDWRAFPEDNNVKVTIVPARRMI